MSESGIEKNITDRLARARRMMENALARAEQRPADPDAIATEVAAALAALESVPVEAAA